MKNLFLICTICVCVSTQSKAQTPVSTTTKYVVDVATAEDTAKVLQAFAIFQKFAKSTAYNDPILRSIVSVNHVIVSKYADAPNGNPSSNHQTFVTGLDYYISLRNGAPADTIHYSEAYGLDMMTISLQFVKWNSPVVIASDMYHSVTEVYLASFVPGLPADTSDRITPEQKSIAQERNAFARQLQLMNFSYANEHGQLVIPDSDRNFYTLISRWYMKYTGEGTSFVRK